MTEAAYKSCTMCFGGTIMHAFGNVQYQTDLNDQ